ncbi:hypothetical protein GIB67_035387 [Kingdonia uniflora]|uniref:t-SNARE coiled-coil homology domain-containing protein n=1 Tax=Kingdonia uniflora TaxID=39325 RepID=A0A7J7MMK8_9MAGN|nr:hypothetical protein GIB67_035387 [Kingdonia uniflora]
MNDLLSSSFNQSRDDDKNDIEMGSVVVNLDRFFQDVESIKDDLKVVENLHQNLQKSHEESKTLHNVKAIKDLRSRMDSDVSLALKKAKLIKTRLQLLDQANSDNRNLPGCGPGSSSDRTRTSLVSTQKKKFKESMENFSALREKIGLEYKETVQRRYFTVTGENPDDRTVELLISTGESETFMQKVIQEQGRGQVMDTISEMKERHDAVKEIEKGLYELHQVFLDMSVMVEAQGEHLDDIESHVGRASSFVRGAAKELQTAKMHQRNTRKWTCYAIILIIIILLIIILPIVLKK